MRNGRKNSACQCAQLPAPIRGGEKGNPLSGTLVPYLAGCQLTSMAYLALPNKDLALVK
jgi:hypothetical protein